MKKPKEANKNPSQFPLREKRKAETRLQLIASAQKLFSTKGYAQTTLEEIAEDAGLHVQTLYRHFANKQELAATGDQEHLARFRELIRSPQRPTSTFALWRDWVRSSAERVTRNDGGVHYREILTERFSLASVSTQILRNGYEYEDLLCESLGKELRAIPDGERQARVIAATLWAMNAYVVRRYHEQQISDLVAEVVRVIDEVEEMHSHLF
ncbi:MAG: TetR/AcrR family transcriptional regulator [Pseudomonadota bacterium]